MDRELIEYFDRRFDETNEETNRRFDEVDRRFEKTDQRIDALRHDMNDGLRQNRILLEDLKGKVDLVIEGAMGFREELKRDVADVRGEVREIQTRLEVGYVLPGTEPEDEFGSDRPENAGHGIRNRDRAGGTP